LRKIAIEWFEQYIVRPSDSTFLKSLPIFEVKYLYRQFYFIRFGFRLWDLRQINTVNSSVFLSITKLNHLRQWIRISNVFLDKRWEKVFSSRWDTQSRFKSFLDICL